MKKLLLTCLILVSFAFYFSACSSGSGSDDDGPLDDATVTKVTALTVNDVQPSGATTVIKDEEEVLLAMDYLTQDEAIEDLVGNFSMMVPSFVRTGTTARRSAVGTLDAFLTNIMEAIDSFPTAKHLDETYSQTNVAISGGFTAKKLGAKIKADLSTTDSKAADLEDFSNVKSIAGEAALNADIVQSAPVDDSDVVDSKMRLNFAAKGSVGSAATADGRKPANLVLTTAVSSSLAVSCNFGGVGGILIINADVSQPVTSVADPSVTDVFDSLTPKTAISVTMYRDNGTVSYSKKFATFSAFMTWMGLD